MSIVRNAFSASLGTHFRHLSAHVLAIVSHTFLAWVGTRFWHGKAHVFGIVRHTLLASSPPICHTERGKARRAKALLSLPDAVDSEAQNVAELLLEYSRSLRDTNPVQTVLHDGDWGGAGLLSRADGSVSIVRPLVSLEELVAGVLDTREGCSAPAVVGRLLGGLLGALPAVVPGLLLEGFDLAREVIPGLFGVRVFLKLFP